MNDAWSTAVDDFLAGRRSPQTRRAYQVAIERYVAFLAGRNREPATATPRDVAAWTKAMTTSNNTARARLAAVSALYDYVSKHTSPALRSDNPTRAVAWPTRQAPKRKARDRALDAQQATELVTAATGRERAIVVLMVVEGLRASEVRLLSWQDLIPPAMLIVTGKGGKRRFFEISETTRDVLDEWAAASGRSWGDAVPIFPGRAGALSYVQTYRLVRALGRQMGFDLSPHPLRATAITEWLNAGAPLHEAQRQAGHASPSTTEQYVRQSPPSASAKSRIGRRPQAQDR